MHQDILQKNLSVLEKFQPKVFYLYKKFAEHVGFCEKTYAVMPARETGFSIVDVKSNLPLSSKYSSVKEAQKCLSKVSQQNCEMLILIGMGCGSTVREALKVFNGSIAVIEPDWDLFHAQISRADISDCLSDKRITFFVDDNPYELMLSLRCLIFNSNTFILQTAILPGYKNVFREFSENMERELTAAQETLIEDKQRFFCEMRELEKKFNEDADKTDFFSWLIKQELSGRISELGYSFLVFSGFVNACFREEKMGG